MGELGSWLTVLIGMALPATFAAAVFLAVLGQEREQLALMVEYYRQIKINADKERKLAQAGSRVKSKIRDLERDAIAVLKRANLIRFVETPKPETPPPTPPPAGT